MTSSLAPRPTRADAGTAVRIRALGKTYATAGGAPVEALRGIDLDVADGEFVCVVGASGCGKSTLLRLVAGFEALTCGLLTVNGQEIAAPCPERGVVFQDYGLFPWMTVAANVGYGPRQRGLSRAEVAERTARHLDLVALGAFADHYPHQLSGGMQQRVAIARVLANDPAVLLMDEPFGALDSLTREKLQIGLREIWWQLRPTVLFVTHNVEEAVFLADRVIVMSGGPNHGVPGHVAAIESVGLEHPRDVTSPAFNAIKRRLLDTVHRKIEGLPA